MPKCDFIKAAKQNTFFRTPFQNTNLEHLFLRTTLGGCFCTIYFGSLLSLLSFMRPRASKVYNMIRSTLNCWLGYVYVFSYLQEEKLKHNFKDTWNPLCSCSISAKSTSHYFLRCHFFDALRATLTSSRPGVFCKKGVLRNFAKFTREQLCQSLFFNKVAGLRPLLKKRLWHRCFPVNFANFLRIPFLTQLLWGLLLYIMND